MTIPMINFSPYIQQLVQIADTLLTPEVLLSTSVLTVIAAFAGRVSWAGATLVLRWFHSWHLRTVQRHTVALARRQLPFDHRILKPRCLIIRYGTDLYVERMACDREKQDGRLQNRVLDIQIATHDDGSTSFRLSIPVHKRLGTQFKCFVDVKDGSKTSEVLEFLSGCPSIASPELSSSPLHPNRLYFFLRDFHIVESIDKHKNNMCFPE
jgi:hypothetical protein